MEISPFPHHGPLEPDQVRGRDAAVADLVERITQRRVTALLGPRRFGKTSLLRRVAADITDAGATVVPVDLYEARAMNDIAVRLDDALASTTGAFAAAAEKVALSLSINLGLLRVELAKPQRTDGRLRLDSLLDVLVTVAESTPTVLVVDEFSSISRVDGAAGLLRTRLQHHFQTMGIVFAGSEPSMMATLFTDRAQPFYAQADLVEVEPFDAGAVGEIVAHGFRSTDRDPGTLASSIFAFGHGHPHRTMELADAAWMLTEPAVPARHDLWPEALAAVRRATGNGMERLFARFEGGEKAVLRILAAGESIYGRAADVLALPAGTATSARARLLDIGDLVDRDGTYQVTDPVMADWIRNRFPI